MEVLAKQPPVTLEQLMAQVKAVKERSISGNKKGHQDVIQGTSDKRCGNTSKTKTSDARASKGTGKARAGKD